MASQLTCEQWRISKISMSPLALEFLRTQKVRTFRSCFLCEVLSARLDFLANISDSSLWESVCLTSCGKIGIAK